MTEALRALTNRSNWDIQNTYVMGGTNFTVVAWLDGTPPIEDAADELERMELVMQAVKDVTNDPARFSSYQAETYYLRDQIKKLAAALKGE